MVCRSDAYGGALKSQALRRTGRTEGVAFVTVFVEGRLALSKGRPGRVSELELSVKRARLTPSSIALEGALFA